MIDLTAIEIHLTLESHPTKTGKKIESCLTAAIKEARQISGRNIQTGAIDLSKFPSSTQWTGAMCYLIILDQIGKCYRPKAKSKRTDLSPIERALNYFTTLSEDEIAAIYSLRNAFFHDFSLFNSNSSKPKYQRTFSVLNSLTEKVVTLPKNQWDGDFINHKAGTTTYINLKALADIVEDIYKFLFILNADKQLILDLAGGENELLNRYTFSH